MNFTQKIIVYEQNNPFPSKQSKNPMPPLEEMQRVYFNLQLVDPLANSNDVLSLGKEKLLKPGRSYQIRVSASHNRYPQQVYFDREGILVKKDIHLRLVCEGSSEIKSQLIIHNQSCNLIYDSIQSFRYDFSVTIPEKCPKGEVTFVLLYLESQSTELYLPVTRMKVKLQGTYLSVNDDLLEECRIELDASFPEYIAMLYVKRSHVSTLHLRGWNRFYELPPFDCIGWKPIKLANFVEQQEPPENVIKSVHKFSRRGLGKLILWFEDLLKRYGEQLCIIITDNQDFEIPWEILALNSENYLGAQARVVRWKAVECYSRSRKLRVSHIRQRGSMIAYLDDEELDTGSTYPERETLNRLRAKKYKYLKEFQDHLLTLKSLDDIGLIYLGCHGYEGIAVGSQRLRSERITDLDLEMLKEYPDPRPIVFVNACASARLKDDGVGLMDVFLARLASSYIGTLGPIGSAYASKVAKQVLQAAYNNLNGAQIAEVLRQLRAEAVKEILEKNCVDENFVYAFMYVYYGNPLAWLHLIGTEEPKPEV